MRTYMKEQFKYIKFSVRNCDTTFCRQLAFVESFFLNTRNLQGTTCFFVEST